MNMEQSNNQNFGKAPWTKWLVLIVIIMTAINLRSNLLEYGQLRNAGIFSPEELEQYTKGQIFTIVMKTGALTLFLGWFLITLFAKTDKNARHATNIFFIVTGIAWLIVGIVFGFPFQYLLNILLGCNVTGYSYRDSLA